MKSLRILTLLFTLYSPLSFATDYFLGIGDSFLLRNGLCLPTETREQCEAAGRIDHDAEFTQYLLAYSANKLVPIYNAGRGGDPCGGSGYYKTGINAGQPVGLRAYLQASEISKPINTVIVLTGYNDVNGKLGATPEDTADCVEQVWRDLLNRGLKVIALTYPTPSVSIMGIGRVNNVNALNNLLVKKAQKYSFTHGYLFRLVRLDGDINGNPPEQNTTDGLHPTAPMAKDMAKKIVGII